MHLPAQGVLPAAVVSWTERVQHQYRSLRFEVDTDVAAFEIAVRSGRLADAIAVRRGELLEQVIELLRARRVLLTLDKFEHITEDTRTGAGLLQQCAGLKLVVTSRIRLGVAVAARRFAVSRRRRRRPHPSVRCGAALRPRRAARVTNATPDSESGSHC